MKIYTIKFYFYGSEQPIPSDISRITSFLHDKVLGKDNPYHKPNAISLYSVSPLFGGKLISKNNFIFKTGAILLVRTPDINVFKDFYLKGKNAITKELANGLTLKDVSFSTKEFDGITEIITGTSPVYLGQNKESKERDHIVYTHGKELTSECLKRIFLSKTKMMGYNFSKDDFNIEFDLTNPIKTRAVHYKGGINITTVGKVKITGTSDIISLFYGLGVGKSTGCCFGFIFTL